MAKRIKAGALDESLIIQSFKDDSLLSDPSSAVRSEPMARVPPPETVAEEKPSATTQAESKDLDEDNLLTRGKPRRRRGTYVETFLQVNDLKDRKCVYVSRQTHQMILALVHHFAISGHTISVGSYIENVLLGHVQQYESEIVEICRLKSIKELLP